VEKFVAAGVMNHEYSHVKLHITVMNSLMRKDPSGTTVTQSHNQPKERISFDATRVLEVYTSSCKSTYDRWSNPYEIVLVSE
jgi:predicted transcriptional regulator